MSDGEQLETTLDSGDSAPVDSPREPSPVAVFDASGDNLEALLDEYALATSQDES